MNLAPTNDVVIVTSQKASQQLPLGTGLNLRTPILQVGEVCMYMYRYSWMTGRSSKDSINCVNYVHVCV